MSFHTYEVRNISQVFKRETRGKQGDELLEMFIVVAGKNNIVYINEHVEENTIVVVDK